MSTMTDELMHRLSLSRHALNRRAELRDNPEAVEALLARDSSRVVVFSQGKALVEENSLLTFSTAEIVEQAGIAPTELLFLGIAEIHEDTAFFAASLDADVAQKLLPEQAQWGDLKVLGHQLSDLDAGLFTQGLALINWHESHKFSPRSGENVIAAQAGWVLRHPEDPTHQIFPRTDPAVIVMVTDEHDRLLLGNNALWEPHRFSLLAGFVEPGESLEAAVIREVFEESGLKVVNPTYLASQPWPFPQSLMLGFRAEVAPGVDPEALIADGEEIVKLRWFTREELLASLEEIVLPGPVAIARVLIEQWLGQPLDQSAPWRGTTA
jgi:NAD+ diphosphatase